MQTRSIQFHIVILCCLLSISISGPVLGSETDWVSAKSKNGINVYTRHVPDSSIYELKGSTVIDGEMSVVLQIFKDVPGHINWLADCKASRVVKNLNDRQVIIYNVTNAPWPLSDRDCVLMRTETPEPEARRVIFDVNDITHPSVPETMEYVRIKKFVAKWIFESVSPEKTSISFTFQVDPGSPIPIPAAIVNAFSVNTPYKTLIGMRRMVKEKQHNQYASSETFVTEIQN